MRSLPPLASNSHPCSSRLAGQTEIAFPESLVGYYSIFQNNVAFAAVFWVPSGGWWRPVSAGLNDPVVHAHFYRHGCWTALLSFWADAFCRVKIRRAGEIAFGVPAVPFGGFSQMPCRIIHNQNIGCSLKWYGFTGLVQKGLIRERIGMRSFNCKELSGTRTDHSDNFHNIKCHNRKEKSWERKSTFRWAYRWYGTHRFGRSKISRGFVAPKRNRLPIELLFF